MKPLSSHEESEESTAQKMVSQKSLSFESIQCKNKGCNGYIVKRVNGCTPIGRYTYDAPTCTVCGTEDRSVSNVPIIGLEEYNDAMDEAAGFSK